MAELWYIIRSFICRSKQCLSWPDICFIANLSRGPCTQQWLHQADWQWRRAWHTASFHILVQMVPDTERIHRPFGWRVQSDIGRSVRKNVTSGLDSNFLSPYLGQLFTQCWLYLAWRHFVSRSRSWPTFVSLRPNLHIWPRNWPRLDFSVVACGEGYCHVIHLSEKLRRLIYVVIRLRPWLYTKVRGYTTRPSPSA